jgi:formylglycine-generating enzyme required for sulfatase activity
MAVHCPKCEKEVPRGDAQCPHCDYLLPKDVVEKELATLPSVSTSWEVLEACGAWAGHKVYKAKNKNIGETVLVRFLPLVLAEEAAKVRMANLLPKAKSVEGTKGVVAIQAFEVEGNQPYFVTDIFDGETLQDRLKQVKTLAAADVRNVAAAVADVLGEAHAKGLPHGDLRASSVILGAKEVRVTDFAVGKVVTDYTSKALEGAAGAKAKVMFYRAPEYLKSDLPDVRADLFSLGCLLLEAGTGERRFPEAYRKSCDEPAKGQTFGDPCGWQPEMDPLLHDVACKLLAPHPADRFADAAAAAAALRGGAFERVKVHAPTPPSGVSAAPMMSWKPLQEHHHKPWVPISIGVVAIAGVAAWFALGGKDVVAPVEPDMPPPPKLEEPYTPQPPALPDLPAPPPQDVGTFKIPDRIQVKDGRIHALTDGAEMILLAGGEFVFGSDDGPPDERPSRKITVSPFLIDRHEVTVVQYRRFCKATHRELPEQPAGSTDLHPVVNVSWADAENFASWARRRLPTEAEWELAARGSYGNPYPWGKEDDPKKRNLPGDEDGQAGLAPPGSFPEGTGVLGIYDLVGNAWEWCSDWYAPDAYRTGPAVDPKGPKDGKERAVRGGSYLLGGPPLRATFRNRSVPGFRYQDIGFRCVVNVK